MNATWSMVAYQRIGQAIMIKWSPGESGAAPKDRRLLLIAWPVGSPGPDIMIGHWHEARKVRDLRPPLHGKCRPNSATFARRLRSNVDLAPGVELRALAREDRLG
jgi:hypothetical protein